MIYHNRWNFWNIIKTLSQSLIYKYEFNRPLYLMSILMKSLKRIIMWQHWYERELFEKNIENQNVKIYNGWWIFKMKLFVIGSNSSNVHFSNARFCNTKEGWRKSFQQNLTMRLSCLKHVWKSVHLCLWIPSTQSSSKLSSLTICGLKVTLEMVWQPFEKKIK